MRRRSRGLAIVVWTVLVQAASPACRMATGGDHEAGATSLDGMADGATPPAFDADAPPDDALPPTSSDELSKRAGHLLEAIAQDDARLASDILFPRDGWVSARDAADAGKEWNKRVAAPFRRAVHALSRHHVAVEPQFVSLELGRAMSQEAPHKHSWKKPLWTVRESRITYVVDGRTRVLSIREMTGWRGAWYVTRLK